MPGHGQSISFFYFLLFSCHYVHCQRGAMEREVRFAHNIGVAEALNIGKLGGAHPPMRTVLKTGVLGSR